MDYNTPDIRKSLIDFFPKLEHDEKFIVTSPRTKFYNCIAFAMGMEDRWVTWRQDASWYWWPDGVERNQEPETLKKAFVAVGFVECADAKLEDEFDKVALYCKDGCWQHAAKILKEDEFHSKFGESYDAHHSGGDTLDSEYGVVYCYMKRAKSNRDIVKKLRNGITKVNLFGRELICCKGCLFDEEGHQIRRVP